MLFLLLSLAALLIGIGREDSVGREDPSLLKVVAPSEELMTLLRGDNGESFLSDGGLGL